MLGESRRILDLLSVELQIAWLDGPAVVGVGPGSSVLKQLGNLLVEGVVQVCRHAVVGQRYSYTGFDNEICQTAESTPECETALCSRPNTWRFGIRY